MRTTAPKPRRTIGVRVDGRTVGTVDLPESATEAEAANAALAAPAVLRALGGSPRCRVERYREGMYLSISTGGQGADRGGGPR